MRALIFLVFVVSCAAGQSDDAAGPVSDTGTPEDVVTPPDVSVSDSTADVAAMDSGAVLADMVITDTVTAADTSVADTSDSGFKSTEHVHIYIDNFCKVTTSPMSFTVPAGETLQLSYHNHSVDYNADVWMMYGGGFLDLAKGATWTETYKHCFGPSPSTGYADISIAGGGSSACPKVRLYIYCK